MRPQPDNTSALDAGAVAAEMRISERTARYWLRIWLALGVRGIRTERARGRYGVRYVVDPDVVTRWRACELPVPRAALAA